MKNIKVAISCLVPHFFILLLLAAGIAVSLISCRKIGKQVEALCNESYVIKNAAAKIETAFEAMQITIYSSILNHSKDCFDLAVSDVEKNTAIIQEQINLVKQNFSGDVDIAARLEKILSELAPMQEEALYLVAQNKTTQAAEYMENKNIPVIQEARKKLTQLIQSAEANEREQMASLQETQRKTILLLIFLGIAGVLFSLWLVRMVGIDKAGGRKGIALFPYKRLKR